MFAKFNISIHEVREFVNSFRWSPTSYRDVDLYFDSYKDTSKKIIGKALLKDGVWDGDGVRELNFPTQIDKRHIFISHSHDDIDVVKRFAYLLECEFGVRCFIDSMIWHNMPDLIKNFDEVYSWNSDKTRYSYKKRNYSTAHVHTMLSTALLEMINNCECFLFIGSDNSTIGLRAFRDNETATLSPWIYAENTFVNHVKPIIPEWLLHRLNCFSGGIGRVDEDRRLNIAYKLDLSSFHTLSSDYLLRMCNEEIKETDFLRCLYEDSGVLKQLKPLLY